MSVWLGGIPPGLWVVACAVLGLIVGSFLNVVMLRMPLRMMHDWRVQAREVLELEPEEAEVPPGIVRQPSHCPKCKHRLGVADNIPLISWLALRGKCRYCKAPISAQYPIVELVCALASAVVAWKFGPGWPAVAGLVFTWLLLAMSGVDARTQLLPDSMTLPLLWLGLLLSLVPLFVAPAQAIVGAAVGYLALWLVYWGFKLLTGKEGMGHGDFKLLAALGAWMGVVSLLPIVLLSSLVGAIIGVVMLSVRGQDRSVPIPFGPFLAAAGWIWFVAGDWISAWYLGMFLS